MSSPPNINGLSSSLQMLDELGRTVAFKPSDLTNGTVGE